MTNGDRLTLAELAAAVGMTARNVRAYQTRGLLQPPVRVGRSSVYSAEHVRRLQQVQQARARGASLALLQTLIAEGRDLEGVWSEPGHDAGNADGTVDVTDDVTDDILRHTAECLARSEVPLAALLSRLAADADGELRAAVQALADAGVFTAGNGEVRVPGSFACAVAALQEQGSLATAAAVRLASSVADAARSVVLLVATTALTVDLAGDAGDARRATAARLGELTAAVVGSLAGRELLAAGALPADGPSGGTPAGDQAG
jgi:DNA-binding transcriptional MerR regulator